MGLPNEEPEETEPVEDHVRNRIECPSPANRKRPRICLAESGQIAPANRTNREGNATGSYCSVEKDACPHEEDPKPSLVTSSLLISSDHPDHQEVVQEQATSDACPPPGWTRPKLEPDW